MSFNEFILPALPQTTTPGLNGPDNAGSNALKSCRHNESTAKGQGFLATLNQFCNTKYDRSRESTGAENTADVSDHSDTESIIAGEMNKSNDNTHAAVEDTGVSESLQATACIHPLNALGLIQQQFFNFLMSANGSFSAADHPDLTAATKLPLFGNLIAPLQSEGQAVQNGQVGIGLFEQLQANISPEATHLYFFEQIAVGAYNHQDSGGAMRIQPQFLGFWAWMATLSTGNPGAQTEALGPNTNPILHQLLAMQGVDSPVSEFAAQSGEVGAQKPTVHPAGMGLNAEFLFKMPAQSQQGGADITENTQAAVVGNTKDGRLSSVTAGNPNTEIMPETKFRYETKNLETVVVGNTKDGRLSSVTAGNSNTEIMPETKSPHETKNSHLHRPPAIDKPSDQTANSKLAAEVAVTKPVEEGFNLKGGVFKNQMPLSGEIVDKVIHIEGDNKDSSLLYGQDQMSEKLAKFEMATPTSESAQRSLSSQAMHQIVQKAVLSFNNGQNEVRIDLKPEFLGHIRMQIVTDSHQVAVKILAESPLVKDMLESNLNQLKADLQAQGLKVDELEVSVAHDSHSGANSQTTADKSKSSALHEDTSSDEDHSEEKIESPADGSETSAENAIDYFA